MTDLPYGGRRFTAAPHKQGREDGEPSGELEYSIERADALVHAAVARLSRSYPEHARDGAALEDLQRMSSHIEAALAALAQIEERRKLTEKELSYRRAFRMLSEATR